MHILTKLGVCPSIMLQSLAQVMFFSAHDTKIDQLCPIQSQTLDMKPTPFGQSNQPTIQKRLEMCREIVVLRME